MSFTMLQYFLDFYMLYCPTDCDKKDCPKDERNNIQSPRGCPRQKKYLHARGDLGVLSKGKLDILKSQNEDPDIVIFRKAKDISLKTYEEQAKHLGLMKKFAENKKEEERLPPYLYFQLKRARYLQGLVKEERETEKEALATIVPVTKKPSAEEKLRTHLKANPDDRTKTNTELAKIIGETPENIRQTDAWKLASAFRKAEKKAGSLHKKLNNERLEGDIRERLEDELKDAGQDLEATSAEYFQYLKGAIPFRGGLFTPFGA